MQVKLSSTVNLNKSVPSAPVTVRRARKPRTGGLTLAVFSNRDGLGVRRAMDFIAAAGHVLL